MTDIVERLMSAGRRYRDADRHEAADEIVRLRAEIEQLKFGDKQMQGLWACDREERDKAEAERDEAREIIGKAIINLPPEMRSADPSDGIKAMRVERDRLRDALAKTDEERAKDARPVIHAALKRDTP